MRPGFPVPASRRRLLDVLSRCLLVVALGASASGCAAFIENFRPIIYGKTAKENYEKGIRSMKGESHLDAVKYFNYVRQSYPTSRWVPWAELGIADAAMGRQAYIEAIDGYKTFIASHPRQLVSVAPGLGHVGPRAIDRAVVRVVGQPLERIPRVLELVLDLADEVALVVGTQRLAPPADQREGEGGRKPLEPRRALGGTH